MDILLAARQLETAPFKCVFTPRSSTTGYRIGEGGSAMKEEDEGGEDEDFRGRIDRIELCYEYCQEEFRCKCFFLGAGGVIGNPSDGAR